MTTNQVLTTERMAALASAREVCDDDAHLAVLAEKAENGDIEYAEYDTARFDYWENCADALAGLLDAFRDESSSASRQFYIDSGHYLVVGEAEPSPPSTQVVCVTSHRARARLRKLLPDVGHGLFSLHRNGDYYRVPGDVLDKVLGIKGIRRSRDGSDLMARWSL